MFPPSLVLVVLCFFAGFVDAVVGGGGLISLPAVLSLGLPPALALGTNKVIGICTATASSFRYWWNDSVSRSIVPAALAAGGCAALGAFCASRVRAEVLRPAILVLLVLAALFVMTRRRFGLEERAPLRRSRTWVLLAGAGIGFYDGFFGPGTGVFLMLAMVLFAGMPLLPASANARVVNLASNCGALIFFTAHGLVDYRLALPGALASFCGGLAGASFAVKGGSRVIRPLFIAVTWLLIGKLIWDFVAR